MVAVSATSPRPGRAADMANAVARSLTLHANDSQRTHPRRAPVVLPRGQAGRAVLGVPAR